MKAYCIKTIVIVGIFSFISASVFAQGYPICNVYYFTFLNKGKSFELNSAKYLSSFNKSGYNNQPSFIDDKTVLISSNHYDETQTDIIKLNLLDNTMKRLTKTTEPEYSPTYVKNKKMMSTVRKESNDDQIIQMYKTNGYNQGHRILKNVNNVGYHLWDNAGNLYLFLLEGEKHVLAVANPNTETVIPIIENIGRCLKIGDNGNLYFIHKVTEDAWYIKSYNPITKKIDIIVRTLKGKEDFELIKGAVISGSGSIIYQHALGIEGDWDKMIDLSEHGINNITRINIKNNKMLLIDKSRY